MSVKFIDIKGKKHPVKNSIKSRMNWEELTGVAWSRIADGTHRMTIKETAIFCQEVLREGYRMEDKKFPFDFDQILGFIENEDLEQKIADKIVESVDEKK